jgi:type IV secretion system protein VirB11
MDTTHERTLEMLATALGAVGAYLHQPDIIEIMVNPDGRVWVERLGTRPEGTPHTLAAATVERIVRLVAALEGTECHAARPTLSAVLPISKARFQGFLPPVVAAPSFVIRRPALQVFHLEDYVREGVMTGAQADALRQAVWRRQSIVIAGATGSGKSTLANAVLALMAETGDRIVTLEDTPELQCTAPNTLALYTSDTVSMRQLVKDTLRTRPDRIVIGEVRDGTALDMLRALQTGHPGLCTVHADSAHGALVRLEQLVQEVSASPQQALIAEVIHCLVHIVRTPQGRRVPTVAFLEGRVDGEYNLVDVKGH